MHLRISQSSQAGFSPKYIFKIFYQPSLLVYQNAILRILVDFLSAKQMSPFVGADPFTGAQRPSNIAVLYVAEDADYDDHYHYDYHLDHTT